MKKKVLFVATVARHINAFHIPYIEFFQEQGWEVHVAVGDEADGGELSLVQKCDVFHRIPITRSPFCRKNLKGIQLLKKLVEEEKFSIIHCHTPMGSVVARLAGKGARKKYNTKILYTCHGAHFFTGAPLKNWLLYYPVEKFLARYTDCFIAINQEDYERAKRKIKAKRIEYVPGVGFKNIFHKATQEQRRNLRTQLGIDQDAFVLSYVGELSKRKNQEFLLDVIKLLKEKEVVSNAKLLLIGNGPEEKALKEKTETLKIADQVFFLGFRNDVDHILNASDAYVAASKHEGLAVNILEALGSGLPVIATVARGQSDLIVDGENGFIIPPNDAAAFVSKIIFLYELQKDREALETLRDQAVKSVEKYKIEQVLPLMGNIYLDYMES